jgi:ribosomal protein S18 acetylase RimI-like enzyme
MRGYSEKTRAAPSCAAPSCAAPSCAAPSCVPLCLEEIDFDDRRHLSLLAALSESNAFYYMDSARFLNIKDSRLLAPPAGSAHGFLAFERGQAVAFIIYHKFDDIPPHQAHMHPAIEIQFHLVDSQCRGRSIGSALLEVVESLYEMRVICVEVDSSRSASYYGTHGYNLNFVTHPFLGRNVTYGRDAHPRIQHWYKLVLNDENTEVVRNVGEKLRALMHAGRGSTTNEN